MHRVLEDLKGRRRVGVRMETDVHVAAGAVLKEFGYT